MKIIDRSMSSMVPCGNPVEPGPLGATLPRVGDTVARGPRRRSTWVWVAVIGGLLGIGAIAAVLAFLVREGTKAGWITSSESSGSGCWAFNGPDWLAGAVIFLGMASVLIGAMWAGLGWPDRLWPFSRQVVRAAAPTARSAIAVSGRGWSGRCSSLH